MHENTRQFLCAKCKAAVPVLACKVCTYTWIPRAADPLKCPGCQSLNWNGLNRFSQEKKRHTARVKAAETARRTAAAGVQGG
jgi:hypothetical protein